MMQRCGHVVITMLANVKQKTIEPLIKETIALGCLKPAILGPNSLTGFWIQDVKAVSLMPGGPALSGK